MCAKDLAVTSRQLTTFVVISIPMLIFSPARLAFNADDPMPSRTYDANHDQVYKAAKLVFSNSGMSVVKAETGYLEAFTPNRSATSPANVGIFIAALGPNQTEVRFDERLHRWINVYPNGWGERFLQRIEWNIRRQFHLKEADSIHWLHRDVAQIAQARTLRTCAAVERHTCTATWILS